MFERELLKITQGIASVSLRKKIPMASVPFDIAVEDYHKINTRYN
jgi:hypothetical protein